MTTVDGTRAVEIAASGSATVLDVRTPAEFAEGHLPQAVNVDLSSPAFDTTIAALPKDSTYLVYCRSGNRSATAARQMDDLGFKHVYDLAGGVAAWAGAGGQLVR